MYYQQVGRAGRAIDHAVGVLISGRGDDDIHEYFRRSAFPNEESIRTILDALGESDGMSIRELEAAVNLRHGQIMQALKFLSVNNPAPVIKEGSRWRRTPVEYRMDHDRIRRLTGQREVEWQEVQDYIDERGCLMMFLANALDDENPEPCGFCTSCLGRPIVEDAFSRVGAVEAARFLQHSEIPLEPRKQVPTGSFVEYEFPARLTEDLRAEVGRILSRWGDAGWGQIVAEDKHSDHFRDDLVDAVAEMVLERWHPEPSPEWVTCVPSNSHPKLVPDYARRLGERLGLPFVPVVTKVRDNQPQKSQQNRFHQCRNLDGVFTMNNPVPNGPVLLVDDVVDSGWTMTVVAALLRRAGSGSVWPVALATSSAGD